jgi:Protein of unknown function (DUF2510)
MNSGGGWYPDQRNPALMRWWDGTTWTDSTQPNPAPATAAPAPGGPQGAGGLGASPVGSWQPGPQAAPTALQPPGPPTTPPPFVYPGPAGQPGGPGQLPPKSGRSKAVLWGIVGGAAVVIVAVIVVVALSSSHGASSTPAAQGSPVGSTSTQQPSPAASVDSGAGAGAPASGSNPSASGSGYATYEFTDNVDGYVYKVTLLKIDPNAQGQGGLTPDPGTYFLGAEFSVTGVSGDDGGNESAAYDATVIGSDDKTYPGQPVDIADGTNLDETYSTGGFDPAPGASVTGWVTFELPNGVSATAIEWSDDLPTSPQVWKLSS